jgi:hypothetical protein
MITFWMTSQLNTTGHADMLDVLSKTTDCSLFTSPASVPAVLSSFHKSKTLPVWCWTMTLTSTLNAHSTGSLASGSLLTRWTHLTIECWRWCASRSRRLLLHAQFSHLFLAKSNSLWHENASISNANRAQILLAFAHIRPPLAPQHSVPVDAIETPFNPLRRIMTRNRQKEEQSGKKKTSFPMSMRKRNVRPEITRFRKRKRLRKISGLCSSCAAESSVRKGGQAHYKLILGQKRMVRASYAIFSP